MKKSMLNISNVKEQSENMDLCVVVVIVVYGEYPVMAS